MKALLEVSSFRKINFISGHRASLLKRDFLSYNQLLIVSHQNSASQAGEHLIRTATSYNRLASYSAQFAQNYAAL